MVRTSISTAMHDETNRRYGACLCAVCACAVRASRARQEGGAYAVLLDVARSAGRAVELWGSCVLRERRRHNTTRPDPMAAAVVRWGTQAPFGQRSEPLREGPSETGRRRNTTVAGGGGIGGSGMKKAETGPDRQATSETRQDTTRLARTHARGLARQAQSEWVLLQDNAGAEKRGGRWRGWAACARAASSSMQGVVAVVQASCFRSEAHGEAERERAGGGVVEVVIARWRWTARRREKTGERGGLAMRR